MTVTDGFDVIVVGAGVNGAGIARDAAMRGLRVLLVDKHDIAAGTTSWSTRLIHGGLRYLEHAELGLVRESLREREILLRTAGHLVRPLEFFIPVYRGDRRGPLLIRLGMLAYELLSFDKSLPRHRMLGVARAAQLEPGIRRDGLRGAAVYYDAQVDFPERMTVETALAAHDAGATVLTRTEVERIIVERGTARGVVLRDTRSGDRQHVSAAVVINVTGPWADRLLPTDSGPPTPLIGGTKGTHLVVDPFPGAPSEALYVSARDGRPFFILPWTGRYLIGTTDLRYRGDLDWVTADDEEIGYLLAETNRALPGARLAREDVLYTHSGVWPLPHHEAGEPGSVTRRHILHDHAPRLEGLISIVGGKLTTYRSLAQQATDAIFAKLRRRAPRCRTAEVPLPGASADLRAYASGLRAGATEPAAVIDRLLRMYGTRAGEVLALARGEPALAESFDRASGALGAEVVFALNWELAVGLDDVLLRRTMVGLGPHAGVGPDQAAAEIAVRFAGWTRERAAAEVTAYREAIRRFQPRALDRATR